MAEKENPLSTRVVWLMCGVVFGNGGNGVCLAINDMVLVVVELGIRIPGTQISSTTEFVFPM